MVIYKYTLESSSNQLELPEDAQFLCIQTQHNEPQVWFLVDPSKDNVQRTFAIRATGEHFMKVSRELYLGTFQLDQGHLVFHLFELL